MEQWIVFTNRETKKEYATITKEGFTLSELKPTIELLAYENNLEKEAIVYNLVTR